MNEDKAKYLKVYQSKAYMALNISALTLLFFTIWRFHVFIYRSIFFILGTIPPSDFTLAVFTSLVIIAIYAMIAIYSIIVWRNTYYEVYPDRFVRRRKVISVKQTTVNSSDFMTIDVRQGLFGRLFGYGDITFNFRIPVEGGESNMTNISQPYEQIKIVEEIFGMTKKIGENTVDAIATVTSNQGTSVQTSSENSQVNSYDSNKDVVAYQAGMSSDEVNASSQDNSETESGGRIEIPGSEGYQSE